MGCSEVQNQNIIHLFLVRIVEASEKKYYLSSETLCASAVRPERRKPPVVLQHLFDALHHR